jgi:fructose-1,6-bisphosphatase I
MLQFEQTFMDFLLEHQERHNRTYHFLILMNAVLNAARRIQHYYLTGALRGNLGLAGSVNVQGEQVLKMDDIANEVVKHYLLRSGRVIHAVSEEEAEIIPMNVEGGRYFIYYDPMDGTSNVPHNLPIGFLFGIAKRNLEGPRIAPALRPRVPRRGMFVIPTGTSPSPGRGRLLAIPHRRTMNYVHPTRVTLSTDPKTL